MPAKEVKSYEGISVEASVAMNMKSVEQLYRGNKRIYEVAREQKERKSVDKPKIKAVKPLIIPKVELSDEESVSSKRVKEQNLRGVDSSVSSSSSSSTRKRAGDHQVPGPKKLAGCKASRRRDRKKDTGASIITRTKVAIYDAAQVVASALRLKDAQKAKDEASRRVRKVCENLQYSRLLSLYNIAAETKPQAIDPRDRCKELNGWHFQDLEPGELEDERLKSLAYNAAAREESDMPIAQSEQSPSATLGDIAMERSPIIVSDEEAIVPGSGDHQVTGSAGAVSSGSGDHQVIGSETLEHQKYHKVRSAKGDDAELVDDGRASGTVPLPKGSRIQLDLLMSMHAIGGSLPLDLGMSRDNQKFMMGPEAMRVFLPILLCRHRADPDTATGTILIDIIDVFLNNLYEFNRQVDDVEVVDERVSDEGLAKFVEVTTRMRALFHQVDRVRLQCIEMLLRKPIDDVKEILSEVAMSLENYCVCTKERELDEHAAVQEMPKNAGVSGAIDALMKEFKNRINENDPVQHEWLRGCYIRSKVYTTENISEIYGGISDSLPPYGDMVECYHNNEKSKISAISDLYRMCRAHAEMLSEADSRVTYPVFAAFTAIGSSFAKSGYLIPGYAQVSKNFVDCSDTLWVEKYHGTDAEVVDPLNIDSRSDLRKTNARLDLGTSQWAFGAAGLAMMYEWNPTLKKGRANMLDAVHQADEEFVRTDKILSLAGRLTASSEIATSMNKSMHADDEIGEYIGGMIGNKELSSQYLLNMFRTSMHVTKMGASGRILIESDSFDEQTILCGIACETAGVISSWKKSKERNYLAMCCDFGSGAISPQHLFNDDDEMRPGVDGETPNSHVFNGLLDWEVEQTLRKDLDARIIKKWGAQFVARHSINQREADQFNRVYNWAEIKISEDQEDVLWMWRRWSLVVLRSMEGTLW